MFASAALTLLGASLVVAQNSSAAVVAPSSAASATTTSAAAAASSFVPLAAKKFDYKNLPYQADTDNGERGFQSGYNRCNSTTAGPDSLCQTAIINSLDDFCLWAPQEPGGVVGNIEGEMVAWCTKGDKYGARTIPAGALQGVTFVKTPHYVQVTGFIDQSLVYIDSADDGGEMDPHGADNRGNPLGGLMFTQAFNGNPNSTAIVNGSTFNQVIHWHNFMGANVFCLKACDPTYYNDYALCEHIYDRVGCGVNAPMEMKNGTFESCLGDDQLPPGVYVGDDSVTSTFTQPPEGQIISTLPYTPFTPSSSSCTTFSSEAIFVTASSTSAAPSTTPAPSSASTAAAGSSIPASGSSAASGSAPAASSPPSSGANRVLPFGGALAVVGAVVAMF